MSIAIIALMFVALIILIGLIFVLFRRTPKLSERRVTTYAQKIKQTQKLDPIHGLMESHKIFIAALEPIAPGRITAAEKVKKITDYIPNEKSVWKFHRLRNRAAHETDCKISTAQAREAREVFVQALKGLS